MDEANADQVLCHRRAGQVTLRPGVYSLDCTRVLHTMIGAPINHARQAGAEAAEQLFALRARKLLSASPA